MKKRGTDQDAGEAQVRNQDVVEWDQQRSVSVAQRPGTGGRCLWGEVGLYIRPQRRDQSGPQRETGQESTRQHTNTPAWRVCCPTGAWTSSLKWMIWCIQATVKKNKRRLQLPAAFSSAPRLDRA